jgi:hypothetical protein
MELFMAGPRTQMSPLTGLGGCFVAKMEVGIAFSISNRNFNGFDQSPTWCFSAGCAG